jgi:hypothetical protein
MKFLGIFGGLLFHSTNQLHQSGSPPATCSPFGRKTA